MKPNSARKAAQRAISASSCEQCGAIEKLQRHHPDLSKPLEVEVLCQPCHAAEHMASGTWGRGRKLPRKCVVCSKEFLHGHSKAKTCSPQCRSERGRQNAERRWSRTRARA